MEQQRIQRRLLDQGVRIQTPQVLVAADETTARYAFVYGDFRRVHRSGLIACQYRAAEWRHKQVELATHDLLQELDRAAGG